MEEKIIKEISFYEIFWIFFIGSVFGWLIEVIVTFFKLGYFVNHSALIYGPIGAVYGIGVVVLTLCLYKVKKQNSVKVFIIAFISSSICEYIISFFVEKFFDNTIWNYSDLPFNINGRICLYYSLIWSALGLIWIKIIYPIFKKIIEKIPRKIGERLMYILIVLLIFDSIISALAVLREKERKKGIPAKNKIEIFLDHHYSDEFLDKIYQNFKK